MDRLEYYRHILRTFLEEYFQESVSHDESVTAELVFDEKRDRYLLVHVGWQGARRIYGCPMHNSSDILGSDNAIGAKLMKIGMRFNQSRLQV